MTQNETIDIIAMVMAKIIIYKFIAIFIAGNIVISIVQKRKKKEKAYEFLENYFKFETSELALATNLKGRAFVQIDDMDIQKGIIYVKTCKAPGACDEQIIRLRPTKNRRSIAESVLLFKKACKKYGADYVNIKDFIDFEFNPESEG